MSTKIEIEYVNALPVQSIAKRYGLNDSEKHNLESSLTMCTRYAGTKLLDVLEKANQENMQVLFADVHELIDFEGLREYFSSLFFLEEKYNFFLDIWTEYGINNALSDILTYKEVVWGYGTWAYAEFGDRKVVLTKLSDSGIDKMYKHIPKVGDVAEQYIKEYKSPSMVSIEGDLFIDVDVEEIEADPDRVRAFLRKRYPDASLDEIEAKVKAFIDCK